MEETRQMATSLERVVPPIAKKWYLKCSKIVL